MQINETGYCQNATQHRIKNESEIFSFTQGESKLKLCAGCLEIFKALPKPEPRSGKWSDTLFNDDFRKYAKSRPAKEVKAQIIELIQSKPGISLKDLEDDIGMEGTRIRTLINEIPGIGREFVGGKSTGGHYKYFMKSFKDIVRQL